MYKAQRLKIVCFKRKKIKWRPEAGESEKSGSRKSPEVGKVRKLESPKVRKSESPEGERARDLL